MARITGVGICVGIGRPTLQRRSEKACLLVPTVDVSSSIRANGVKQHKFPSYLSILLSMLDMLDINNKKGVFLGGLYTQAANGPTGDENGH